MNKLHVDTLLLLKSAAQYGLTVEDLVNDLRQARHRTLAIPEAEAALRHLADKSFAMHFTSALGNGRWRITELGKSALQEEGL